VYGADVYGTADPVDPDRVVARLAAVTEQAVADGFRGLRVSAEASEFVRTPAQRDAFARYEFLVGCYMTDHPLSALCGYEADLGDDVLAELVSLHTPEPSGQPPFQVFGCADGAIGLAGEFDPSGVAALGRLLPRLHAADETGPVVVDLAEVEYVDHRLLRSLSELAGTSGVRLSLRSPPPFAARLMALLPATYLEHARLGVQP
jgi:anti-anti-sigma regulatory factor